MKKIYILLVLASCFNFSLMAQDTLAGWTFPTGTASDSIADIANVPNVMAFLKSEGGTSAIDFSKNGFTTKAAQATGWDNGDGTKAWLVYFKSTGYENLTISSRMQSGGNNPGPLNYTLQYLVNDIWGWQDVPNGLITTANDWTTSQVNVLPVPSGMNNQSQYVALRWLMTGNMSSGGSNVVASGTNKIDEVFITGTPVSSGIQTPADGEPNAWVSQGRVHLKGFENIEYVRIYDIMGRQVYFANYSESFQFDLQGIYVIVLESSQRVIYQAKFVN